MSHQPPVPQGNRSPHPIEEPPHPTHAEPAASKDDQDDESLLTARNVGIGAAIGVAAAAAIGAVAYARSRGKETEAKPKRARAIKAKAPAAKAPAKSATTRKASEAKTAAAEEKPPKTPKPRKRKAAVSDNPVIRGAQDAAHIAMTQAHEVAYWTKKFGVDRDQLQAAVDAVGHGAEAVTEFFATKKG